MICAHCGSYIPDDMIKNGLGYCQVCTHKTRVDDEEDDLIECPVCHQMRDRTAWECRWCGCSFDGNVNGFEDEIADDVQAAIDRGEYNTIVYRKP